MEIQVEHHDSLTELIVHGVLDNSWADHLSRAIDDAERGRSHRLVLNLSHVTYLSSAGISTLLRAHGQFQRIHGFFAVVDPSPQVRQILKLTGLEQRLISDRETAFHQTGRSTTGSIAELASVARGEIGFELYELPAANAMRCRLWGDPANLPQAKFAKGSSRSVVFGRNTLGLGVGAFGDGFDACCDKFGEFLAVAGAVVQQPSQAGAAHDYQLLREEFIPSVEVLYGLECTGDFTHLVRFERLVENNTIDLSTLIDQCLQLTKADAMAIAVVAESAGMVGAALRRSPAAAAAHFNDESTADLFTHPEVRDWLSFSPERVFPRSLMIAAGVAQRVPGSVEHAALKPFLRPLDQAGNILGHFHASPFPYIPLKKRRLHLVPTIEALFDAAEPQGVLHLLGDFRPINGVGESQVVSGACWMAPIAEITLEAG